MGVLDDLVERGEHLHLRLLVLHHRLDDELSVGELAEVGRETEPAQGGVAIVLGELARADGALQRALDAVSPDLGGFGVDLVDEHVDTGPGAHLGDTGPHEAATDHAYPFDAHRVSSVVGPRVYVPALPKAGFGPLAPGLSAGAEASEESARRAASTASRARRSRRRPTRSAVVRVLVGCDRARRRAPPTVRRW